MKKTISMNLCSIPNEIVHMIWDPIETKNPPNEDEAIGNFWLAEKKFNKIK
jgi:hypothetical protein